MPLLSTARKADPAASERLNSRELIAEVPLTGLSFGQSTAHHWPNDWGSAVDRSILDTATVVSQRSKPVGSTAHTRLANGKAVRLAMAARTNDR